MHCESNPGMGSSILGKVLRPETGLGKSDRPGFEEGAGKRGIKLSVNHWLTKKLKNFYKKGAKVLDKYGDCVVYYISKEI
jgi:hypothetical protein